MATKKEATTRKAPAPAPGKSPKAQPAPQQQAPLERKGRSAGTTSRRSPEEIAQRAYELWLKRGAPHGSDQDDWLAAERELDS